MPTAALWSISALFSISLVMCVLHPPAMPNPWCSASFWTLFHLLLCQSHFSFCVYILKLLWNISKSDWASGTLTQNESQQSPPSWTSTHTAYSSIECFQRMLGEFHQLFPLHSKGEKPKVHTLWKKTSLAKAWGEEDELIGLQSVYLEVSLLCKGPKFEVPVKLLWFHGYGSHLERSTYYLCNTYSRLTSKMLAFDQEKTLSKANLANISKSASVARWCSGTTAAPWPDSLANTGNCNGWGCTLLLHLSLHNISKVCQLLHLPAAPLTSKAVLPAGSCSTKYCCTFQTASLSNAGKGANAASLAMHFSMPFPSRVQAAMPRYPNCARHQ